MSRMATWVKKATRPATCFWCGKEIESGTFMVVCSYLMPTRGGKVWTKKMYFHAEPINCWFERAKAEIESRPAIINSGRKPNNLSDSRKEARNKLLRRYSATVSRFNREFEGRCRHDKLALYAEQMDKLKDEIEPYGGVPESWL